jgi:hypothetical protein
MVVVKERLGRNEALKLVQQIRLSGDVVFFRRTKHADDEAKKDELGEFDLLDIRNVLAGGKILSEPEQDEKTLEWKYRVETPKMAVVFKFESETAIKVITAWRKKR